MTIIIFIIILAVLILIHEFGHFIVAKKLGVRVDEFAIGFPPKIFSFKPKKSETTYTINAIPFGGFVKIFGENPDEDSISGPDRIRSFVNKPKWVQAIILSSGVLCNIIFAWILISISLSIGTYGAVSESNINKVANPKILVLQVLPSSPAENAGLKIGDEILFAESKSNGFSMQGKNLTVSSLENLIGSNENSEINILYKRKNETGNAKVKPIAGIVGDKPAIGIVMSNVGTIKFPFYQAPIEGLKFTGNVIKEIVVDISKFIYSAITGVANLSNIAGPVGIVGLVGDAWRIGFVNLMMFVSFISINLAILNIIPFPALDGGRIFFILIEKIKGSPIKPKIANTINTVGFLLLIGLMFAVTYSDIAKLFK